MERCSHFMTAVVSLAAVFFMSSNILSAQENDFEIIDVKKTETPAFKWEVRASVAGYPSAGLFDTSWDTLFGERFDYAELKSPYDDYYGDLYSAGVFSIQGSAILKKWLTVAANVAYAPYWRDYFDCDGNKLQRYNGCTFAIWPEAIFTYIHKPAFKLYSAVGLGVMIRSYSSELGFNVGADELATQVAFQITPLGLMAGKRVFFFAEMSYGTVYMGGRLGLGYRF